MSSRLLLSRVVSRFLSGVVCTVLTGIMGVADAGAAAAHRWPDGLLPVLQQTMQRDALTSPTSPIALVPSDLTGVALLGVSVALDGDTAIVGVPFADVDTGSGISVDKGVAYVFVRQAGVWTQQAVLHGGATGALFGSSVAIAGDMAIVGAPRQLVLLPGPLIIVASGAGYVFTRAGSTWSPRTILAPNDPEAGDEFGTSVAFDGSIIMLGAPLKESSKGAAYLFVTDGSGFVGPVKLTASDGASGDHFGSTVAVHGATTVIGAGHATIGGHAQQGAAYVFTPEIGVWTERTKLTASDGAAFDLFGRGIAIQGDTVLIGAPANGTGRPGCAYFFTRAGANWSQQKLTPPDSANDDAFGVSVALDGTQAVVGAQFGPTSGLSGAGAAYVFRHADTGWLLQYALIAPGKPSTPVHFGLAVALSLQTVLVGAPQTAPDGVAYVFGSTPPVVAPIADVITVEDASVKVDVTVSDAETDAGELLVSAVSTDALLLPATGLVFDGSGGQRTLKITPGANQNGEAFIAITVSDGFSTTFRSFRVRVLPVNTPATISPIADQTTTEDTPRSAIPFTINDVDTALDALLLFATSSNTTVVPSDNITVAGTGAARTLTITPASHQRGSTVITLFVTDGAALAIRRFTLTVQQPTALTYYLAEGSTGAFFDTDLLLANPNDTPAPIAIAFFKEDGTSVTRDRTLPALSRTTIRVDDIAGMDATAFATSVSSTGGVPLVVERTMRWDGSGYGAHGEKAVDGAALQWYFAEGSQGFFSTFFLLVTPGNVANTAHVRYLREHEPPVSRDYALAPTSRVTVNVAAEPDLINRSFGASVTFDQPGVAERAMYFGRTPLWTGGHDSVGATAPSTAWFLAEGATGTFFNTFILLANPNADDATATVTYLPATGAPVTREYVVAAGQRVTINIALEDPSLASAAVSTRVDATRPIVVELSQYWPAPATNWYEAHNSFGVTATGTHWGLAEGRVGGGAAAYQTFILLANPGTTTATVTIRFLRANGAAPLVKTVTVEPTRRFNVAITGDAGSDVPELTDEAFGAAIESTQPIAVERTMYSNANGVIWAAGTSATATRLP